MPRPKKDHKQITIKIATEIYDRFCKYTEETGVTKTATLEKALEMYLDEQDRKKAILEKYDK